MAAGFPPEGTTEAFSERCEGNIRDTEMLWKVFSNSGSLFFVLRWVSVLLFPPNIILTVILECCWGYFFKKES